MKISPDLAADELESLCDVIAGLSIDGVIATNTSTRVPELRAELEARGGGGVSGAPLAARSLEVLRALRQRLGPRFPIINVGGIMSAQDVLARLAAGANLVQVYTGFVYRGPALVTETLQALS